MRLTRLLNNLEKNKKFPYCITDLTNINYLTGFGGSYANLIIDESRVFFITDSRYIEYAGSILPDSFEIIKQDKDVYGPLREILSKIKKKKLFIEESLQLTGYLALKKELKRTKIIPGGNEVNQLRITKDENELEKIGNAVRLTDECFSHLLKIIKPGIQEWDIAVEIEWFYRKNGCRKSSFDSIVASGKGSSMPHYITSMTKKIDQNDILLIDMGCTLDGYNSDLTRTIFVGGIDPEFEKIYGIVKEAQERAISSAKAGMTTGELDRIARDFIKEKGYGPNFGHGLGHGLGMNVHEDPRLKEDNKFILEKNIPFTIEPGIYIPDKGGVRIEDVVVTTENGYVNFTDSSKEIIIL